VAGAIAPPDDYLIGVEDVLVIVFWRDKDMSAEVVVRPDGKITLPLINDVVAAGLTPDQLREKVSKEAERFIEEPAATVVVKQINSRKVYITGEVGRGGPFPLTGPTTVLQLIAMAGGLKDFAHKKDIVIMRTEAGKPVSFPFDYSAVVSRKKLQQNILLKPGDTVVVP
jgi:polysaccharide export outer membrane protein